MNNQLTLNSTENPSIKPTPLKLAGWFLILLGIAAIVGFPTAAVAIDLWLGFVLLLAGTGQLVYAWNLRTHSGSVWRFLWAICYLLAGSVLLLNPPSGIVTLAFVLGVLFLVEGVFRFFLAAQLTTHRLLLVADGVLVIAIGAVILSGWPADSTWVVGVLVGIRLIVSGILLLTVGPPFQNTTPL